MAKGKKNEEIVEETTAATTEGATTTTEAPAAPKVLADIVRGRMPLLIVYLIKFKANKSVSDAAKMFKTTVGKVTDITKDSNFQYITEGFAPTKEMIDAAIAYAGQLGNFKDEVLDMINKIPVATAEQVAAFEAVKATFRKPREKKATAPAAEEMPPTDEPTAPEGDEDLLD